MYRNKGLRERTTRSRKRPLSEIASSLQIEGNYENILITWVIFYFRIENSTDVAEADKLWLKSHKSPWEIVEDKWKNTFHLRRQDILNNCPHIFITWPLLTECSGYGPRLVGIFTIHYLSKIKLDCLID